MESRLESIINLNKKLDTELTPEILQKIANNLKTELIEKYGLTLAKTLFSKLYYS